MGESQGKRQVETREFWEAAVRLWEESRLSVREFCSREGLGEHSLHAWRKKLRGEGSAPETDAKTAGRSDETAASLHRQRKTKRNDVPTSNGSVEFMPVRVVAEKATDASASIRKKQTAATPLEVVHISGWRVRIQSGFDAATLDAVLSVLERRGC